MRPASTRISIIGAAAAPNGYKERSVKFTDHWEEEGPDGTILIHDRERFSHELTLIFSSGKTQVLTHEKQNPS